MNHSTLHRFAAAFALLWIWSSAVSVEGACGSAFLLHKSGYIYLEGAGPYTAGGTPNFTGKAAIVFWSLGTGDPVIDQGDDSGIFDPGLGGKPPLAYGVGSYYNYENYLFTNWGATSVIDGCVTNAGLPGDNVSCVLITDTFRTSGYFALLGSRSDFGGNFDLGGGPTVLLPMPRAAIGNPVANGSGFDFEVTAPVVVGGVYGPEGGDCAPVAYRVHSATTPEGAPPPTDLSRESWTAETGAILLGDSASVFVDCAVPQNTYLSTTLVFPDGFETE